MLYTADSEPSLTLAPETLNRLAKLDCGFWLDFYPMVDVQR